MILYFWKALQPVGGREGSWVWCSQWTLHPLISLSRQLLQEPVSSSDLRSSLLVSRASKKVSCLIYWWGFLFFRWKITAAASLKWFYWGFFFCFQSWRSFSRMNLDSCWWWVELFVQRTEPLQTTRSCGKVANISVMCRRTTRGPWTSSSKTWTLTRTTVWTSTSMAGWCSAWLECATNTSQTKSKNLNNKYQHRKTEGSLHL